MAKTIIKEIFIILLVTIAIGLVLAVIFYQFIPSNKIIPSEVTAYSAPEEVKEEILEAANQELSETSQVYEITDSDLDLYKSTKSYNPGKVDPFSSTSSDTSGNENSTPVEGTGGNSGTTQNTDKNTTDNYYQASNIGGRY